MRATQRLPLLIGGLAVAMALLAAGSVAAVWATLEASERDTVAGVLAPRTMLVVMLWLAVFGLAAWGLSRLFGRFVEAPARLYEQAQASLTGSSERELEAQGSAANRGLAETFNALLRQRSQLQQDVARQVAEASRGIEEERSRLSALMAELTQSVVVCNLDGRILLYNSRARAQFRAWSNTPVTAGGAELIGLGRSIYAVFERQLIEHALERIEQRARAGAASPSAQFVTPTPRGQLLRVQMAPVHNPPVVGSLPGATGRAALSGFVLMLDDITRDFEQEALRDRLLLGLTEGSRASLGNLQAAVEMLELPDLEAPMRERFQGVVRDEVGAMTARLQALAADVLAGLKTRWPMEDMLGADLVAAGVRRIEALGSVRASAGDVDAALWLKVDSYSLLQALAYLASRLVDEHGVNTLQLRLRAAGSRAQLDLVWAGLALSTETVMSWQMEAMRSGADATPLTLRDVVERHGGEFWFERERVRHEAFFRFLLPCSGAQGALAAAPSEVDDSRPEFYDFDLFQTSAQARAFDDRSLAELTYTVFDTETTGLSPSEGDEIIQIGAIRIVNGRLLRQECFEQLVDPQRPLASASALIHGIPPEALAGQPTILEVLPVFHAFAIDTVLVAHNAAFDMRFLQLKEAATGLRFDQPVLDTLLLSAWVQPNQVSHGLEAIAERLGVAVTGRHTAIGDAKVTAEVFLKLIPLLQARGVVTLGQARSAALQTYQARLRY
ncbi:MAG: exonuclease domain-containing protein [Caldimonas sp.]